MRTILFINSLFLILSVSQGNIRTMPVESSTNSQKFESRANEGDLATVGLNVSMQTPTHATINFKTESEQNAKSSSSSVQKIPHLVLNRNGVLTPGFERTLHFTLDNFFVPRSGAYARLVIMTQHADPDLHTNMSRGVEVWQETKFVPYNADTEPKASVDFKVTFQHSFENSARTIQTPSDYYRYELTLFDTHGNKLSEISKEYAFLMENQWKVPLPKVLEDTPGAAPNELVLYYFNMAPFQTDPRDPDSRLLRSEVDRYVQTELIPAMVNAFQVQTNSWNMPWYAEWYSQREEDAPKTLSVALDSSGTWYHGEPPSLGHAMISIRVDGGLGEYSSLTEGIMSVFHHELFHNQQRNLSLHFGSGGNISGLDGAWKAFSEGTAVLASSVGQPQEQFDPLAGKRSYFYRANAFLGADGLNGGDLNKSYKQEPYHTAIYWRFLYEHCGGLDNGVEDPAAGMKVIREALKTLYQKDVIDINSSADLAGSLPHVMDVALKNTSSCEFDNYEESLTAFARSIYLLRLKSGSCPMVNKYSNCGFYDPYDLYQRPNAIKLVVAQDKSAQINDKIPSSYGIDLLELGLDPSLRGRTLKITFESKSDSVEQFNIELWHISSSSTGSDAQRLPVHNLVTQAVHTENGKAILEVPVPDLVNFDGLGLVITRVDPGEGLENSGLYQITVAPN
jgi:hypothetical protein